MNTGEIIALNINERYNCSKRIKSVKCIDGLFWITYKCGKDIIINADDNISLIDKKKVIIQVIKSGSIYLEKKNNHISFFLFFKRFLFKSNKIIKSY